MLRCHFLNDENNRIVTERVPYNTLIQGWIELKNMDRAMDLFKQMKRTNECVRCRDIQLADLGWARQMRRIDMAEKVMQDLMNDRDVSPVNGRLMH